MLLQPDISFGETFTIGIKAQSFGWLPARQQNGQVWSNLVKKGAEVRGPLSIIEDIAKRYNFEINMNDGKPFEPVTLDYLTVPQNITQTTNDLIFMKSLALRSGCRFFITHGNRINLIDGARARKPEVTFIYRGQIDPADNVFPIDTFDSETTAMFLPRTSIAGRFFNPNDARSKKFKKWNASEATAKNAAISGDEVPKPDGDGPTQKAKDGQKIPRRKELDVEKGAGAYMPVVLRQKELANKLQSQMDNMFKGKTAQNHGVSAKVSGVDVPTLLPEALASVKGVGDYHSVNYRVFRVEHVIGEAFAVMNVDLHPKGFPGNMAKWLKMKAPAPKIYDPGGLRPDEVVVPPQSPTLTDARPGSEFEPPGGGLL
jgi:hypothetical protein